MLFADNRSSGPETGSQPTQVSGGIECRVYRRHACNVDITCQPVAARDEEDPTWSGKIKDVSLGGIGLLLSRRFERGVGLAIELPGVDAGQTDTYLARVVHIRKAEGGEWLHGCEFVSRLSDDELERLVQSSGVGIAALDSDNRAVERHRVSARALWRPAGTTETTRDCAIHDVSSLGLALISPTPVNLNSVLEIMLLSGEGDAVSRVRARVVNVNRQAHDAWLIGCALVEELRSDDMLPLHAETRKARSSEELFNYPCAMEVLLVPGGAAATERTHARVLNVSPSAVGLAVPRSFVNGAVLRLQLPKGAMGRGTFLVRVVLSAEHGSGGWAIGCEFASQLSGAQLHALGAS